MKPITRIRDAAKLWTLIASALVGFALPFLGVANSASADDAEDAIGQAQNYYDTDEVSKAVAVLSAAARVNPKDRRLGAMLYAAVRDHVWEFQQVLPVQLKEKITALAFNADNTRLAIGSAGGEVFVTSTESDAEGRSNQAGLPSKSGSEVIGLAFSKDGTKLLVARRQGPIEIWDREKAQIVYSAPELAGKITAFDIGENLELAAIGSERGDLQVVDVESAKAFALPRQPEGKIFALAFTRSSARLAVACGDNARVWEPRTGRVIGPAMGQGESIVAIDWSADERYLASGSATKIKLSDPEYGVPVMPEMKCSAPLMKLLVSPDGSKIGALLKDSSVGFWDALTGKPVLMELREDAPLNDFLWSRSGLRGVTASQAGHSTLWTLRNGTRRGEPLPEASPVLTLAISSDSKYLATGSEKGVARIWRTDAGMPLPTIRYHNAPVSTAFYSLDGQHLVTCSEDHTALHWKSGQVQPFGPALMHPGKVTCGVFNRDATRILTGGDSGFVKLWDAATGHAVGAPIHESSAVNWVDFHPSGARFVVAAGRTATVWGGEDHAKPLAVLQHPGTGKSEIKCARFSPDGRRLATGSTDGTVHIWDADSYQPLDVKIVRGGPVLCVRFSPDGSRLVVAGEDNQAAVYDTASWQIVGVPVLAPGPIFSAAITDDNLFMVISSLLLDAVQFFEIRTGRPLGQGVTIPAQATCVDYLSTDKVVALACDDGTVRAVEAPFVTEDVPAWMCDFAERSSGWKKSGAGFERVEVTGAQLGTYLAKPEVAKNDDFARLVRWKLTSGSQRNGMPRFTSTIAANIERRADERSVDALFDCYEAVSGDPTIIAALSLYLPSSRHGEFLADLALRLPNADPVARCFAASTLIKCGRSREAEGIITDALKAAPDNPRVLCRAGKMRARIQEKAASYALFERALQLQQDDSEIHRSYAWALYNFGEPAKAEREFAAAQNLIGEYVDDLIAGLCLCEAARHDDSDAQVNFKRLVALDARWKKPEYLTGLRGWTQRELGELERVRSLIYPAK